MFHGVHKKMYSLRPNAQRDLTIDQFEKILSWLDQNFEFITPEQYFNGYKGGVLLTFDDGLANNYTNVLPILEKHNAPALFFIPTQHVKSPKSWLWFIKDRAHAQWNNLPEDVPEFIARDLYDGMSEDQLKKLAAHPLVEIGSHSVTHPKLINCTAEQIEAEVKNSKSYLEQKTGCEVNTFAYPQGLYNKQVLEACSRYYEYGFAVKPLRLGLSNYEIARISLHSDDPHYLNLKFSGLHRKPTIIET